MTFGLPNRGHTGANLRMMHLSAEVRCPSHQAAHGDRSQQSRHAKPTGDRALAAESHQANHCERTHHQRTRQSDTCGFFVALDEISRNAGHAFYRALGRFAGQIGRNGGEG